MQERLLHKFDDTVTIDGVGGPWLKFRLIKIFYEWEWLDSGPTVHLCLASKVSIIEYEIAPNVLVNFIL